ncbi:MAG: AAA family ATPase [Lentilactobacillus diolivorans]|nr:AAA family ATPase [Lentilactobacillus diolivorans]
MIQYSYSRTDLWHRCPYHYKLRYIDRLTEMQQLNADNPLIVGHALHKGIEAGMDAMRQDYLDAFPVRTDLTENELIKLEILLPKVQKFLEQFNDCKMEHEVEILGSDFKGFADLIITAKDGTSCVIDFKYSNSINNYVDSGQLHLYKYYLDKAGYNIKSIGFLFIPKTGIRQKKTEDLFQFRKRLVETVTPMEVNFVTLPYDDMHIIYFRNAIKEIESATEYPRNLDGDCFACKPRFAPEYLDALQEGDNLMPIPKNERREKTPDLMPDTWLYGDSYVGKSVFWDSFPDVLMINTDGNTDNTTSPYDLVKDVVTKTGRITDRKYAWVQFVKDVEDLEAGNPEGYKTIVLDLVEDLYESCRAYILHKNNWEHESDGGFGKGWSAVTNEFHNVIKRLKVVGLQVVYISREDRRDINLKNGAVRTTFNPNIAAKVANFLTGTVDITMRAYVNDEDQHVLQLQKATDTFGGGRYEFKEAECPLEREEFLAALKDAQPKGSDRDKSAKTVFAKDEQNDAPADEKEVKKPKRTRKTRTKTEEETEKPAEDEKPKRTRKTRAKEEPTEDEKPKRTRRTRKVSEEESTTPPGEETKPEPETEAKSKRTRRRRTRKSESDGE